jgi:catechol 2,3-dioxygenase-like lactoylglutathione lyase family enzyme
MQLNHLNLTVTDVPEAYRFLEKYFGLRKVGVITSWLFCRMTTA